MRLNIWYQLPNTNLPTRWIKTWGILGPGSISTTDCLTGRRTILPCYLSIAEWSDPSCLLKRAPAPLSLSLPGCHSPSTGTRLSLSIHRYQAVTLHPQVPAPLSLSPALHTFPCWRHIIKHQSLTGAAVIILITYIHRYTQLYQTYDDQYFKYNRNTVDLCITWHLLYSQ